MKKRKRSIKLCTHCKWFKLLDPKKIMDDTWEGGYFYYGRCENDDWSSSSPHNRRFTNQCGCYECKYPKFIQKLKEQHNGTA